MKDGRVKNGEVKRNFYTKFIRKEWLIVTNTVLVKNFNVNRKKKISNNSRKVTSEYKNSYEDKKEQYQSEKA